MTVYTTAQKINALNNMNVAAQRSGLGDMVYGASNFAYPGGDYPGRVYFVNNITGSDTLNDGLSWDAPFAELSAAITASEAYRATFTAYNRYIHNVIYVQGTETPYAKLTALPLHCDIVGLGNDPRGNGTGIVIIGAGGFDAVDSASTVRGLNLYNLQFNATGAYYAFDATAIFRSKFVNCAFYNGTSGTRIVTGGGIVIQNCIFGGDTAMPSTALAVGTAGGNFNNCLVEDSFFYGSTNGFTNGAGLADNSLFRNNTVYGGTDGIIDTTPNTPAAWMFYVGNYVAGGTRSITATNGSTYRLLGNHTSAGGTGGILVSGS
jgi:hypothetical protein